MRRLSPYLVLSIAALLPVSTGFASELPIHLLKQLRTHPTVIEEQLRALATDSSAEAALALPNPKIELGINNLPVEDPKFDRYLPTSKSISFSQAFPSSSKRESQSLSLLAQARLNRLKAEDRLAELEQQAIQFLSEKNRNHNLRPFIEDQQHYINELEEWLKGEMESGSSLYARFAELDVQRSDLALQLNALDEEESRLDADLHYLFGSIPDYLPLLIEPTPWNGETAHLYPLQIARQQIAIGEAEVRKSRAELNIDYSFGLTYQQRDEGINFDGEDWITVKFGMSLPLWKNSNQLLKKRASESSLTANKIQFDNQLRNIKRTLLRLYADFNTLKKRADLLDAQQISLLRQKEAVERRYESGEGSLEALVRLQMTKLKLSMQQLRLNTRLLIITSKINRYFSKEIS